MAENFKQEITNYNFTMKHSRTVFGIWFATFHTVKLLYTVRMNEYHIEHNPVRNQQQQLGTYCDSYPWWTTVDELHMQNKSTRNVKASITK